MMYEADEVRALREERDRWQRLANEQQSELAELYGCLKRLIDEYAVPCERNGCREIATKESGTTEISCWCEEHATPAAEDTTYAPLVRWLAGHKKVWTAAYLTAPTTEGGRDYDLLP